MRVFGAVVLVLALTSIGICKAIEFRKCLTVMHDLILMLDSVKSELCTSRTPMNRIIQRIEQNSRGEVNRFAGSLLASMDRLGEAEFSSLWRDTATDVFGVLPQDCITELSELGTCLGRYDMDMQLEAIDRCKHKISNNIDDLRPKNGKIQKMYIGLYGGTGLIIAIMLI
ncbi:MAG: stage III sporulation protein AB [Bacillota bacterium]|nr:stage III sporulation protein AB [Bacillota bacterium]